MTNWRHKAACRDEDPDLFFPIGVTGPALEQVERAKVICARCEVCDQCLEWALDTGQDVGVWGGKTEDERRSLRRHLLPLPERMCRNSPGRLTGVNPRTTPRPSADPGAQA